MRLSQDAIDRVRGKSWELLKGSFLEISRLLLSASPDASGNLTSTYVKYHVPVGEESRVYAVAWLKTSKIIVVGLALPDDVNSPRLSSSPVGYVYRGITKYFTVSPGDSIPPELRRWARDARAAVVARANGPFLAGVFT